MIGSRLGIYEVSAKLGAGAMGEVYRARDTRLGRDVAIKVLPPAFTADPERLARFEREAKALASLNHPHIATIHGLEEAGGALALVMELVPGEDLAARIARGPLPFAEALDLARQIASALDAAHDSGIIHRDLKPANVLVTSEGVAKVLDFGLAKSVGVEASGSIGSGASPTITSTGTEAGLILGTAAYMSPEQARGKAVDRRTDVWSFACVLYEMVTGKPAFAGETITDILAAIVHEEPDWNALPVAARPRLERLLRRCLVKSARERVSDLGDVAIVLKEIATEKPTVALPVTAASRQATPWMLIGGIALTALAGGWLAGNWRGDAPAVAVPSGAPSYFQQLTISPGGEGQPSISPDGESFVYVAGPIWTSDIFSQRIGGRKPVNLTADCAKADSEPAFSPDGRSIAYRSECSGGGIFVMGATGESPRKVSDIGYAPAWSPDAREIAYVTEQVLWPWARSTTSTLWAVDVDTGKRRKISEHDAAQPAWSPDGKRIAFWGLPEGGKAHRDLYTVAANGTQLADAEAVAVTSDPDLDWSPAWAPDGKSIYFSSTRGGTYNVWRIPVDPAGRATAAPTALTAPSSWVGWISLSRDGRKLIFVDRNARMSILRAPFDAVAGKLAGTPQPIPLGTIEVADDFDVSPDGSMIHFANSGLPQHLFLIRADGTGLVQLTDGPYRERQGNFSPDGNWIVFQTTRFASAFGLIRTDGSGLRELPSAGPNGWFPNWTPDGRRIVFGSREGPQVMHVEGDNPRVAIGTHSKDRNLWPTSISADGRTALGSVFDAGGVPLGVGTLSLVDGTLQMIRPDPDVVRLAFLPDGQRYAFALNNRILVSDLSGAHEHGIVTAAPDRQINNMAISRDGKWIVWLESADESDIWMATLENQ